MTFGMCEGKAACWGISLRENRRRFLVSLLHGNIASLAGLSGLTQYNKPMAALWWPEAAGGLFAVTKTGLERRQPLNVI